MSETISLENAQKLLATFGISRPTREYERWAKDYGFDLKDFSEVLFESRFVFSHDWRGSLESTLECLQPSLRELGADFSFSFEGDPDGCEATVSCGGETLPVQYRPSEQHDFRDTVDRIVQILPDTIEFRESPHNGGTDGWCYAFLLAEEWREIELYARYEISQFFIPLNT